LLLRGGSDRCAPKSGRAPEPAPGLPRAALARAMSACRGGDGAHATSLAAAVPRDQCVHLESLCLHIPLSLAGKTMGKSVFICPVPTPRALEDAIRAIVEHNVTESKKLGVYSDEEFRVLDPKRFHLFAEMKRQLDEKAPNLTPRYGCKERWTRGESIPLQGCIVKFRDELWLEVINGGGGACTTAWLKAKNPGLGWIGTEGKPAGFMEAPMVTDIVDFATLRRLHADIVAK